MAAQLSSAAGLTAVWGTRAVGPACLLGSSNPPIPDLGSWPV